MNEDHDSTHLLPEMKERESVSVDLQLLQGRLIGNSKNAFVLLLNLLDVGVFLDTFYIILLPFAQCLNPSTFKLLEPEPFVVVSGIEASLWILQLAHIVSVFQSVRYEFSSWYVGIKSPA